MSFVPAAPLSWRLYRSLVRTHVEYFTRPASLPDADILKLNVQSEPVPQAANLRIPTVVIDLTPPEETLWAGVERKTRKVIRQAEREGVGMRVMTSLSQEDWHSFRAAYDKLQNRRKKVEPLGIGLIHELIEKNRFVMTVCADAEGNILSWHCYVRCGGHARLHETVSTIDPERGTQWNNMVGRAHRLHHWKDMLFFKAEGVRSYDLGGVYRGTQDQEQIGIARFKTSFGGVATNTFNAVLPLTARGRFANSLRKGFKL
jgi:hypothetical protein